MKKKSRKNSDMPVGKLTLILDELPLPKKLNTSTQKKIKEFDFSKARKVIPGETKIFRRASENTLHIKLPPRIGAPKHRTKK